VTGAIPGEAAGRGQGGARVLVTGGAGFIGANLSRTLAADPGVARVTVLDDFSTGLRDNLTGLVGIDVVEGSILDVALLAELVPAADAVVHLAARPSVPRSIQDPLATHEVNATGTLRILEAARLGGGVHVVVASSSSVYGSNRTLPAREDIASRPLSPYAASKLAAEGYALAYAHSFSLPVTVFRFFNVFGPLQRADHDYAAVVPIFVAAALRGDPLPVHGDGGQTRDFTFVDSVVGVLRAAVLDEVVATEPVNLAFGGRHSLLELIGELEAVLGRALERRHGPARPGDVRDSQADQTRLRALFPGLVPTSLTEGLRRTVEWFESLPEFGSVGSGRAAGAETRSGASPD
jgi:UDP-glucose 4-epimerase